jgi:hypothetical protein
MAGVCASVAPPLLVLQDLFLIVESKHDQKRLGPSQGQGGEHGVSNKACTAFAWHSCQIAGLDCGPCQLLRRK